MTGRPFDEIDFGPEAVPVSHAATVMLIDDRGPTDDLHVLMVRRTARVVFAPDNWVFPGGRVDPEDHLDDFETLCRGLSDREASAMLDIERGGLAWWIAACRETLEEAGLLLGRPSEFDGGGTGSGNDELSRIAAELRQVVADDEYLFPEALLERGIALDVSALEEVARFVTPVGSPRRFDARFFVARAPADQSPSHDEGEIVSWEWFRPRDALDRWAAGEMTMMSPTVRMVACLARYDSADDVLAVARRRLPYQRVRVDDPGGEYRVILPGEPGYDTAEIEIESGWVRLWEG